jgi:FkbM family methyltransferase
MNWIEKFKLKLRASKYKNRDDKGGIAYILDAVKKGNTVLDIGAHKGGYLYFMQKNVGKDGQIHAFEPQSFLYNYLAKMKPIMHWDNVTINNIALSDNDATATLFIPTNVTGDASSPSATIFDQHNLGEVAKTETVYTTTMDHYCEKHQLKPDVLKIDVEGNELKVFKGAVNTLQKFKPKIIVEIEAAHVGKKQVLATFGFLKQLGYQGSILHGTQHLPLADFSFEKHQNKDDMEKYCNNFIFE